MQTMKTLKARVENGRIVMNEPTDLPEGTELELIPADEAAEIVERDRVRALIRVGIDDADAGRTIPASELWRELESKYGPDSVDGDEDDA